MNKCLLIGDQKITCAGNDTYARDLFHENK